MRNPRLSRVLRPSLIRGSSDTASDTIPVHSLRASVLSRTIPALKSHGQGRDAGIGALQVRGVRYAVLRGVQLSSRYHLVLRGCATTAQRRVRTRDPTPTSRRTLRASRAYEPVVQTRLAMWSDIASHRQWLRRLHAYPV